LDTTRGLLELLYRLEVKPRSLLSGSAVGYYGHHGDEVLDESGACSPGFSQDLCQQWEQMASRAMEQGVRVCLLRLGVVLDRGAGAFPRMALPFRLGLGHWMGGGRQWLSWVHRRDVVRAILFLLQRPELDGAFNVTAPYPVTSRGLNDAIKRHRRIIFSAPVPSGIMRAALGEMADELLLNGQKVLPVALQQAGFTFDFPTLDAALPTLL
ncbi:MAG: TIGR01777 family protein, partial [Halioglobus sp.]|nr:TIGR01777 family protein [Halioglobus sp.]